MVFWQGGMSLPYESARVTFPLTPRFCIRVVKVSLPLPPVDAVIVVLVGCERPGAGDECLSPAIAAIDGLGVNPAEFDSIQR